MVFSHAHCILCGQDVFRASDILSFAYGPYEPDKGRTMAAVDLKGQEPYSGVRCICLTCAGMVAGAMPRPAKKATEGDGVKKAVDGPQFVGSLRVVKVISETAHEEEDNSSDAIPMFRHLIVAEECDANADSTLTHCFLSGAARAAWKVGDDLTLEFRHKTPTN